jgi:hypothetical protein
MTPGYVDFEFDLPGALLTRLVQVLDQLVPAALDLAFLADIPDAQGVYQLFFDGALVYIGKTDAEAGLRRRLERHQYKIQHRAGLDPARVAFKAVRIYVFTAVDLETQLINHYGGFAAVRWNGSGFGSNDPGRERDTTTYRPEHFDAIFPIDIDRALDLMLPASGTAAAVLFLLKSTLPYVFRYQSAGPRSRRPHPDLEATVVSMSAGPPVTARRVIQEIVRQLPTGWQATQLPSHIILYKEAPRPYAQGVIIGEPP